MHCEIKRPKKLNKGQQKGGQGFHKGGGRGGRGGGRNYRNENQNRNRGNQYGGRGQNQNGNDHATVNAVVLLQNRQSYEHLIHQANNTSAGLKIDQRSARLRLRKYEGNIPKRVRNINKHRFPLNSFQLGNFQLVKANARNAQAPNHDRLEFAECWNKKDVMLELNGREKRQFTIEFTCNDLSHRFEVKLKNILWFTIQYCPTTDQRVLVFSLRFPGQIFTPCTDYRAKSDSITIQWWRSLDPTPVGAFGACACVRLVGPIIGSKEDKELLAAFRQFQLKPKYFVAPESLSQPVAFQDNWKNNNWSDANTIFLKPLPYATRYLIHALLSSFKIYFTSEDQIRSLCSEIQSQAKTHSYVQIDQLLMQLFVQLQTGHVENMDILYRRLRSVHLQKKKIVSMAKVARKGLVSRLENNDDENDNEAKEEQDLYLVRRVYITPLRICPQPPMYEKGNRILRHNREFQNHFIRVTFVDENFGKLNMGTSGGDIIENRMRALVLRGIEVAGRSFNYLAYSNSQLREGSCWMYDPAYYMDEDVFTNPPRRPPSINSIRSSMGDLDALRRQTIGKYGARIGQGFSNSSKTVQLESDQVIEIPDVEKGPYCFSDGVGRIASDLADQVAEALGLDHTPSGFQIRYKGAKGMLTVCPDSTSVPSMKIALRPSMIKFLGHQDHRDLEVLSVSQNMKCYLNRQIIVILSTKGVPDLMFLNLLHDMMEDFHRAFVDPDAALAIVQRVNGHSVAREMLAAGFKLTDDRFLYENVLAMRNHLLLDIQLRARIFVPKGFNLIGVMDEWNVIPEGHVFFQWTANAEDAFVGLSSVEEESESSGPKHLQHGQDVVVYRCPCLHPGDVQVLKVFYPEPEILAKLEHLVNVVVFPATGARPHPDELAGGDLDGDIYGIIYDPNLIPAQKLNYPAASTVSTFGRSKKGRPLVSKDIENFFVDYLKNDNLGIIANAHLAVSDWNDEGVECDDCLELADLHAVAVDFNKTGVPAIMNPQLLPFKYPHYMENSGKSSYRSKRILGKLYDRSKMELDELLAKDMASKLELKSAPQKQEKEKDETSISAAGPSFIPTSFSLMENTKVDEDLVIAGAEAFMSKAKELLVDYNQNLWEMMCRFEVFQESTLICEVVSPFSKKQAKSRLQGKGIQEHLDRQLTELKREYLKIFEQQIMKRKESSEAEYDTLADQQASAWYQVTYAQAMEHGQYPLLSFPWMLSKRLCAMKKRRREQISAAAAAANAS